MQGHVLLFGTLLTQSLPEKLLGKAYTNLQALHTRALGSPWKYRESDCCLFHPWSFMRREMGPVGASSSGSFLVCADNYPRVQ
jgi:hypothetical protein